MYVSTDAENAGVSRIIRPALADYTSDSGRLLSVVAHSKQPSWLKERQTPAGGRGGRGGGEKRDGGKEEEEEKKE